MIQDNKNTFSNSTVPSSGHDYAATLRHNVLDYIARKNITLNQLAEESGLSVDTLKSFLYKHSKDCKLSTAIQLANAMNAEALEISIDELVGAETIPELTKESLAICRKLSENDLLLVRWFIRTLDDLSKRTEPNKRYVSIMLPELDNNGHYKLISKFEKLEITDLQEPLRSKIFIGFKLISDHYLPYYFPNDIILIANDRPAKPNEHVLVRAGDYVFLVRRVVENGVAKYYSIRDGKYRIDESEVDELVGYVVCKS